MYNCFLYYFNFQTNVKKYEHTKLSQKVTVNTRPQNPQKSSQNGARLSSGLKSDNAGFNEKYSNFANVISQNLRECQYNYINI